MVLDEAQRYDGSLVGAMASRRSVVPMLLGATDAAASAGVDVYTELRTISGVQAAARNAAPTGQVASTVNSRVAQTALGRSTRALGVLALAGEFAERYMDARTQRRILDAAAEDARIIIGLEDAQRLLASTGADPAMVDGLSDAVETLMEMSRSRFEAAAAAAGDALVGSIPSLAQVAVGYVVSGGAALVIQQAAALAVDLDDYVHAVLTVSAMTTMGEALRDRTESLIAGEGVGGAGAGDYAVRELVGLQHRLAADATATVYSMLWRDCWSRATTLGGIGRGIGLTLAEWFTGDGDTREAFERAMMGRIGLVRTAAVFDARLPDMLANLRSMYAGPMETDEGAGQDFRAGVTRVFDGMEFVWIPAGEFRMGSTGSLAGPAGQPVRRVRIGRGYWLGKCEVTQAEWRTVMGSNPSRFDGCGPNCPLERVLWNDAQRFLGRLNGRAGRDVYRLPSEAEWEYATRAGTETETYAGDVIILRRDDAPILDGIAWYGGNSRVTYDGVDCLVREGSQLRTAPCGTHRVGQKAPNAWGLHDVLGNVGEWVEDCWHRNYDAAPGDGTAWTSGGDCRRRVVRGGSWVNAPDGLGAAVRFIGDVELRSESVGFRVARMPDAGSMDLDDRSSRRTAGAEPGIELAWKLDTGTDLVYRVSMDSEIVLPQGMRTFTSNLETSVRWNVLDVDADGNATVRVTTERVRMRIDGPTETASVDSADGARSGSPLDSIRALAGTSYSVVLDPRGALVGVSGLDQVRDALRAGGRDLSDWDVLKPLAGLEAGPEQWSQYWKALPEGTLGVGSAWESEYELPVPRIGSIALVGADKVESIDGDIVVIGSSATLARNGRAAAAPPGTLDLAELTTLGATRFDAGNGRLLDAGNTVRARYIVIEYGEEFVIDEVTSIRTEPLDARD